MQIYLDLNNEAFNSTRCIRNPSESMFFKSLKSFTAFNSTRCIRNQLLNFFDNYDVLLSTPHGALGTKEFQEFVEKLTNLSTPHGALGTPNDHIN